MKKTYFTPECKAVNLPTGQLFTLPVSGNKTAEDDNGGWSKKFWGVTEEDEEEKDFAWD